MTTQSAADFLNEYTLRNLIKHSPDGIVLVDTKGRVVEWNHAAEQITNCTKQAALGKYLWDVQYSLNAPKNRKLAHKKLLKSMILQALKTGKAPWMNTVSEREMTGKNGETRIIQQTVFSVPKDGKYVLGSIMRDVTDTKKTERLLQNAFEHAPIGMLLLDRDGNITKTNPVFARIASCPLLQLAHCKLVTMLADPVLRRRFPKLLKEAAAAPVFVDAVLRCPADKLTQVRLHIAKADSETTIVQIEDITEKNHVHKQLQDLPQYLMAAHEQEKQALSHEMHDTFKHLLVTHKLTLQTALAHPQKTAKNHELLKQTDQLITATTKIVNSLRPEVIDHLGLMAALKNLANQTAAAHGVLLTLRLSPALNSLSLPVALHLYRIVQEATTNSLKYTKSKHITVSSRATATHLFVKIVDSGPGFTPSDRQILNPKGGMGLRIMMERAKALGGNLSLTSAPHTGTTIAVTIPIHTPANMQPATTGL